MNVRRWSALALAALLALTAAGCGGNAETEATGGGESGSEPNSSLGVTLGYAEGVTEVEDPDALQKAVNEMFAAAQEEGMELEYRQSAVSNDGINFSCYLANSASNDADLFIAIYGDSALTDELFLSQLLPPGKAFDQVTLNHELLPGNHTCYVVFTQVEMENGEQVMTDQNTVTVTFTVEQ